MMTGVREYTNKNHLVTTIYVTFSGAVNASEATEFPHVPTGDTG